jgi:uncharacterized membrane protein
LPVQINAIVPIHTMRLALRFFHIIGAIGLMGALASLIVLVRFAPPPSSVAGYASIYGAMAEISTWIFFPSLALTLIAGLLAIAVTPAFHNAGWVGAKLATGILIFEGGLINVQGPIQEEAKRSANALAGAPDPAMIAGLHGVGQTSLWVLLAVATANVVLGVWRPRFSRSPD